MIVDLQRQIQKCRESVTFIGTLPITTGHESGKKAAMLNCFGTSFKFNHRLFKLLDIPLIIEHI
jgi:predicted nucleic acid binding AN1-type Zn finger protein